MAQADSGWELVKPAAASGWEPVSAPESTPSSPNSDQFTANPHGEGLYDMTGPNGTIKVPFSKVQDANKSGYRLANTATMTRYANDARYKQKQDNPQSNYIPLEYADPEHPWNIREAGKALHNLYAGAANMVMHPIQSALAMGSAQVASGMAPEGYPVMAYTGNPDRDAQNYDAIGRAMDQSMQQGVEISKHPLENMEAMLGQAALLDVMARVPGGAAKAVRAATGTTPEVTAELARNVAQQNADAAAAAEEENIKAGEKRKADLQKFHQQRTAAQEESARRQDIADRKVALERGVEQLDPELKDQLKATEEAVNEEANRRYAELDAKLDGVEADPEFLPNALVDATQKIKGTETEPTILKSMESRIRSGDVVTYRDLQGYRSEIGRELAKGTLPGDVFHAFKGLQEAVTDEMQRIADNNGMGPQFRSARDYYRRYAETFLDRDAVARKALDSKERGEVVKAYRGKDQSGIEQLAQFNPELARRLNTVRGYADEARSTKVPAVKPPKQPTLGPKPEPVVPDKQTIGWKDIQAAKEESAANVRKGIHNKADRLASYGGGFAAVYNLLRGHFLTGAKMVGGAAGVWLAGNTVDRLLASPRVMEALTKPTAEDIAQIPPELRGQLGEFAQAAQARGIKVSPKVYAALGLALPQTRTQYIKDLRDSHAYTDSGDSRQ